MNSKELAQHMTNGSHSVGELFQFLILDAKALIQARKAQSVDAQKSCYLDQNAKWVSACNKSNVGLNPEAFMDFCKSQPNLKGMFEPTKQQIRGMFAPSSPRTTMITSSLGNSAFDNARNMQLLTTATKLVETFHKFKETLTNDPRFKPEEANKNAASMCVSHLVLETFEGTITSKAHYDEYVTLVHHIYRLAMVDCPEMPERSENWVVMIMFMYVSDKLEQILSAEDIAEAKRIAVMEHANL